MTLRLATRTAALSWVMGAMFALAAPRAHAAATLVSSTPTRYAALIHAPRLIRLQFSEAVVGKTSTLGLTDLSGHPVRVTPVKSQGDEALAVRIDSKLDAGVYVVHWKVVSAVDGSTVSGSYQFTFR